MTRTECTDLFLRYREISRLVWNLGFWPYPECREWASERAYDSGIARLFEGMILRPLGCAARIEETFQPGVAAEFTVETTTPDAELLVDKHLPDEPGRLWGNPVIRLRESNYQLKFIAFFDWYQLAPRDFRLLEVLIQRLDDRPDLVGHHALLEMDRCSIFLLRDDDASDSGQCTNSGEG